MSVSDLVNNTGDVYWAAMETEDTAAEFFRRGSLPLSGPYYNAAQILQLAFRTFYGAVPNGYIPGNVPSSAYVGRAGDAGEIVTLKINWARTNAQLRHQLVTSSPLSWQTQAANGDVKSRADAIKGGVVLENLWRSKGFDALASDAVLMAIIFGEHFLFTPWDPLAGDIIQTVPSEGAPPKAVFEGDIWTRLVPTWDALRDPAAPDYKSSPWLAVRIWIDRHELVARWPDRKDDILRAPTKVQPFVLGGSAFTHSDPGKTLAYFWYHKRTPALPLGRQMVMLAPDCVLEDKVLDDCYHPDLPLHRMAAGADIQGRPYAYTDFWETMGAQQLADDYQSSLATNMVTFGKQLVLIRDDIDLGPLQVTDGPKMIRVPPDVPLEQVLHPVQMHAPAPEGMQQLAAIEGWMQKSMGLNNAVLGDVPHGLSGVALTIQASAAVQQSSDLQKRYLEFVTETGRQMLRTFRAKATTTRKLAVVGKRAMSMPTSTWTGKDLEAVDDVYVIVGNAVSQTTAGRLQLAEMYLQQGWISVPEDLESVVETGRLEPMIEDVSSENLYIGEENEELLNGRQVQAIMTDSHQMHIRKHRSILNSVDARGNPQIVQAVLEHIQEHLNLMNSADPRVLAIFGEAGPPPAPPGSPPLSVQKQVTQTMAQPGPGPGPGNAPQQPAPMARPGQAQPQPKPQQTVGGLAQQQAARITGQNG